MATAVLNPKRTLAMETQGRSHRRRGAALGNAFFKSIIREADRVEIQSPGVQ